MAYAHSNQSPKLVTTGRSVDLKHRIFGFFTLLLTWQARENERRHLEGLPDYLLKDMGLHRADVEQEARKPFWIE